MPCFFIDISWQLDSPLALCFQMLVRWQWSQPDKQRKLFSEEKVRFPTTSPTSYASFFPLGNFVKGYIPYSVYGILRVGPQTSSNALVFANTIVFWKLAFVFLELLNYSKIMKKNKVLEIQKQVFKIQLYLHKMLLYFIYITGS